MSLGINYEDIDIQLSLMRVNREERQSIHADIDSIMNILDSLLKRIVTLEKHDESNVLKSKELHNKIEDLKLKMDFNSDIKNYEKKVLKAIFPPTILTESKNHSYVVIFDELNDLWRSSAILGDKVFCSSIGDTPVDAFDNLMMKL